MMGYRPLRMAAMKDSLPLGFSTIGDPDITIEDACRLAHEHGLDFIELRCLEKTTDLPAYFDGHELPTDAPEVRLLASSLCLLKATPEDVEMLYQFAALAHRLGARYVRVFGAGGAEYGDDPAPGQLAAGAELVRKIRHRLACEGWACELLLETHDVFSSAERCVAFNACLDEPIRILWDSHHTWRLAGETPGETWEKIGPLVEHVHYKDSVTAASEPEGYRYVMPGEGEYPHKVLLELLRNGGYGGGISLEWEKLWHRYLSPMPQALPLFVKTFTKS